MMAILGYMRPPDSLQCECGKVSAVAYGGEPHVSCAYCGAVYRVTFQPEAAPLLRVDVPSQAVH